MIRPAIILLALATVAACHSPRQAPPGNDAAAASVDQFASRLAALPAAQRDGVFMRAITDAGFSCQKIEQSARHAPIEGRPAWSLVCDHGNGFVALAAPGDVLQIVPGRPADAPAP